MDIWITLCSSCKSIGLISLKVSADDLYTLLHMNDFYDDLHKYNDLEVVCGIVFNIGIIG